LSSFSKDQVFMDVDTVEPGVDFVRAIEKAVGECDVLVALIGKRWAGGEASGTSRLDNEKDYVRLEVSTALARDIRVIPVLVDGMTMPNEDNLPSPVQPITRRNAIEISNTRFNYDVDQLITAVRKILDATEAKRKAEEEAEAYRLMQEDRLRLLEARSQRTAEEEEYLRELQMWRSEEEAKRKADNKNRSKDIASRLVDYVADEFKKEQGVDLRNDSLALQRLKEAVEKALRELSSIRETEINLPFITADATGPPKHLNMKLTRLRLESFIEEVRRRTVT
jgi:Hsp70 protein/TIR domain